MKYFFIMNPGSRGGKSKKMFNEIFKILEERKIDYEFKITENIDDAYHFSKKANQEAYDVIIAVGGDGTINQVVNGFYDDTGKRISNAKFGIIYTGTSPDICKYYNIPVRDVKASMDVFMKAQSRKIEIGEIVLAKKIMPEFINKPFAKNLNFKTMYFIGTVNIGVGPMIARYANSGIRKYLGDFLGTFISIFRSFVNYHQDYQVICFDGKEEVIEKLLNITIGKINYIASGIKVKTDLENGDGSFFRLAIKNIRFKNLLYIIRIIYSGKEFKNTNEISIGYCSKIDVYGNNTNSEVEFDGDQHGFLFCKIEVAKDMLDLIVGGYECLNR